MNVSITATPTASTAALPSVTASSNGQDVVKSSYSGSSGADDMSKLTDPNWVKDLILGEFKKSSSQPKLDKYDFVREILTLIHVSVLFLCTLVF